MATIVTLDTATRLKLRLRRFAAPYLTDEPTSVKKIFEDHRPTSVGHALYLIYWMNRGAQGFEEFRWESLDIAQRLVWERTAEQLGLNLEE